MVNIAGFTLELVEDGRAALAMRVVAGKPTPARRCSAGRMTNVVLNPYWNVPAKHRRRRRSSRTVRRDPCYCQREGFEVTRSGSAARSARGPGRRTPWGRSSSSSPTASTSTCTTPRRARCSAARVRSFSHGCIRIEKPFELAEYLLKDDPRLDAGEDRRRHRARGRSAGCTIPARSPSTSSTGPPGPTTTAFSGSAADVYKRDAELARLLAGEGR